MTKIVNSARGAPVDFNLLRMKQELAVNPTTVVREKPRRRRKLSDRVQAPPVVEETTIVQDAPIVDEPDAEVDEPAKIVRRKKKD